jgi:hypothetical protein
MVIIELSGALLEKEATTIQWRAPAEYETMPYGNHREFCGRVGE